MHLSPQLIGNLLKESRELMEEMKENADEGQPGQLEDVAIGFYQSSALNLTAASALHVYRCTMPYQTPQGQILPLSTVFQDKCN